MTASNCSLRQSVAGNPRLIVSSFKIATDIEWVGDHVVTICGRTLYTVEHGEELIY